jgi:beta-glucosidase
MRKQISRRQFEGILGTATLASATLSSTAAAPQSNQAARDSYQFPQGFVWGCATAAYQIEGAAAEDGRRPSVWDTFAHAPGNVQNGDTGDIADDSYHRYEQDVQLLHSLGARAYRFSIAWPRVFPDGTGRPNEKGIGYYERLVDTLAANGIEPYATLFHWDLPQALEDRFGGWQSQETSKAFGAYAELIAKRLSDRIHHFFTMNEFSCFTDEGYGTGTKAPGKKLSVAERNQVRHNAVLAHGMAVQAIRAAGRAGTQVGLAENAHICVPAVETVAHIEAAQKAMRQLNAPFLTALLEGKYLDSYLSAAGPDAPRFTVQEMSVIGSPLDFVGVNVYTPTYICAADSPSGYFQPPRPSSAPHMASPWLFLGPEIGYWAPRHLGEIWKVKNIYITENGCSSDDRIAEDGKIYDTDRVMYLRNHLTQAQRASAEGWPLRGYFLWSLEDNFEWTDGYGRRFGIHYVDFETQRRIPKLSAEYYREVIRQHRAV